MTPFFCTRCHQPVFFENTRCEPCGALLGFVPEQRRMVSFEADENEGVWHSLGITPVLRCRPCANYAVHNVCNWTVPEVAVPETDGDAPAGSPAALCVSCVLTRLLPNLEEPQNLQRWGLIEQAKRRLMFTLMDLELLPQPKASPEDATGLTFHFVASQPGQAPVMTGHDRGVITLNIDEADDVQRETVRVAFGEPMRTLLGHLRHEVAHYLQYRWIDGTTAMPACRAVFGDEREDYAQALARYHVQGPTPGWEQSYISAYASAHPWEDWAETCAHFLLMLDAVQTASAWGLRLDGPAASAQPHAVSAASMPMARDLVLSHWLPVAQFLNAMNRSLGHRDSYPFLIPNAVLTKLSTVQMLLRHAPASPSGSGQDDWHDERNSLYGHADSFPVP